MCFGSTNNVVITSAQPAIPRREVSQRNQSAGPNTIVYQGGEQLVATPTASLPPEPNYGYVAEKIDAEYVLAATNKKGRRTVDARPSTCWAPWSAPSVTATRPACCRCWTSTSATSAKAEPRS